MVDEYESKAEFCPCGVKNLSKNWDKDLKMDLAITNSDTK